jgi:hypothetical protein
MRLPEAGWTFRKKDGGSRRIPAAFEARMTAREERRGPGTPNFPPGKKFGRPDRENPRIQRRKSVRTLKNGLGRERAFGNARRGEARAGGLILE